MCPKDRTIGNPKLKKIKMSEARIIDTIEIPESGLYKIFEIGRGRGGGRGAQRTREREVKSNGKSGAKIFKS